MTYHESITKKLEQALYLTSNVLPPERIESISTCIHAEEWAVAFEILCSNLYEYEFPISKQTYKLLEEIGLSVKAKKDYWELLKSQIIPGS